MWQRRREALLTDSLDVLSNLALDVIHVKLIYRPAILVAVTSECSEKMVICKIWTGTFANSAENDRGLPCLLKLLDVTD